MSKALLVTIGLEVHAQLGTRTKIFCGCEIRFGSEPNTLVCPVCLGLPGALPVLNREVFRLALRAVLAFQGTPSAFVKFDRKNYFYPDLPKGYQISQFDCPIGRGGFVEIPAAKGTKKIRLNRIHMEEDAGKLVHDNSPKASHVDLNRAGTPLIEMVSEPDIESPEEAYAYLTQLKAILKAIRVSDCDMEKGQLRCDANISLRKETSDPLGKKVEIKNLNSFKAVKNALQYEIKRQTKALAEGQAIAQETVLWNEAKQQTFAMRSKEEAHDYRYFPEPDLVPFTLEKGAIEKERSSIPELPKDKRERFIKNYTLNEYDAGLLTQDAALADFFESCAKSYEKYKAVANWLTGPVAAFLNEHSTDIGATRLTPGRLVDLMRLVDSGALSLQAAKEKVLPEVIGGGSDPKAVMEGKGLVQVSDDTALEGWIDEVIRANPKVVNDFKSGKENAAMFLVGQTMKKSKGKANPGKVQQLIRQKLKESS